MGMFLSKNQKRREQAAREKPHTTEREKENYEEYAEQEQDEKPRRGRPPRNDDM